MIGMNTNTRMTDEEVDWTVAGMRMTEAERAKLARLAKAGEPGACFTLRFWANRLRQLKEAR